MFSAQFGKKWIYLPGSLTHPKWSPRNRGSHELTRFHRTPSFLLMRRRSPEVGTPQTILFALLKNYLAQTPFEPFRVVTTSGRTYDVPTADHAVLFPMLRRLSIADDYGGLVDIHTLHVAAIEKRKRRRARTARIA